MSQNPPDQRSDYSRTGPLADCIIQAPDINLPRKGCRVGLRIVLFEDCSAFTRVTACTLGLSPIRDTLIEGSSHFVASMTVPIPSGWSDCRVGLHRLESTALHGAHPYRKLASAIR